VPYSNLIIISNEQSLQSHNSDQYIYSTAVKLISWSMRS